LSVSSVPSTLSSTVSVGALTGVAVIEGPSSSKTSSGVRSRFAEALSPSPS
jgi:hypothetical protein